MPDGVSQVELEDTLGTEKIRRGTPIDYDHVIGNSTVMVSPVVCGSTVAFCTAQVLNRYFWLTEDAKPATAATPDVKATVIERQQQQAR